MKEKKNALQGIGDFLAGKGFYIVLFACVAVIGVSAWILLFSDNNGESGYTGDVISAKDAGNGIFDYGEGGGAPVVLEGEQDVFMPSAAPSPTPRDEPEPPAEHSPPEVVTPSPVKETVAEPTKEPAKNGDSAAGEAEKKLTFSWPLLGTVEKSYAVEELVYSKTMLDWRTHDGIDISGALGAKVMSVADGTVVDVYDDELFGTTVVIDHGSGIKSHYSNLAATPVVKKGDKITGGAVIGAIGTTAQAEIGDVTHLHFAMTLNDESCDPGEYLPKR